MRFRLLLLAVLTAAFAGVAASLSAQAAPTANSRMATRAELERLQVSYDQLAASTAYSERTRAKARAQSDEVRRRLRDGDFRVGDRVLLRVDGGVTVNDTFTVSDGPRIEIPGVRQVDLLGVLRAELQTKVTVEVREIVKEATITVRPLTRVAVFGAVTAPGYFSVPSETTLDRLLTLAGGPTENARTDQLRLMRGETVLLRTGEVAEAIAQGRTLEALDARDGDILEMGRRDGGWQTANTLQLLTVLVGPIITFLLLR
jgi:protein involved in polysaccharide export with SLBB domain